MSILKHICIFISSLGTRLHTKQPPEGLTSEGMREMRPELPPQAVRCPDGQWETSGSWFFQRKVGGNLQFDVRCPNCPWEDTWLPKDEFAPGKCPWCGYSGGKKLTR
jgi:hypothetical protein